MADLRMGNNRFKFIHLIPSNGYGGVENAGRNFNYYQNKNFTYKVIFIQKNISQKNTKLREIFTFLKSYYGLFVEIRKQKNIVLISSLWKSSIFSLILKIFKKEIKLILFLHNAANVHALDNLATSLNLYFADQIWADSKATIDKRLSSLIIKRANISKKTISFLLKRFEPMPSKKIAPNFIYWGRLNQSQKNIFGAIKFFKTLSLNNPNSKFIMIGHDDGIKDKLISLINTLGIEKNVLIVEYKKFEEIKKYAQDCSFYLQLSFFEGMAMSVVEAMQLGLIPIVTNVGEIENYCEDKYNSIIFRNEKETSVVINNLLENKKLYFSMRQNAIDKWVNCNIYKDDILKGCNSFFMQELN